MRNTSFPHTMVLGISFGVWAMGCSPRSDDPGQGPTTLDDTGTGSASTAGDSATTSGDPGSETSTTTGDTDTPGCGDFICPDDAGLDHFDCDPWAQDCPTGSKCMPWANDGGNSWNATKCAPLDSDPKQPGDPCTVEGNGVSGIDDCDVGAMCWDVDPETNIGYCVDLCKGSQATPMCDNPSTACSIYNDGVLPLCLPLCDPLVQDCSNDNVCVPKAGGDAFVCVLDASGDEGQYGDPCEFVNVCDPGLFCAVAQAVPGCMGSLGCCSAFCDLTAADPDAACLGAAEGQMCVPWFEPGQAPPGYDDVGACAIPQ